MLHLVPSLCTRFDQAGSNSREHAPIGKLDEHYLAAVWKVRPDLCCTISFYSWTDKRPRKRKAQVRSRA